MLNTQEFFSALKKVLKGKKITYRQLATEVSFSEGTLKNIFHSNNASLERIFEICEAAQIDFQELVKIASREKEDEFSFTLEQETYFARYPEYYYFFRETFFQRKSIKQMIKEFGIKESSAIKYALQLEKLGLCDVLPGNQLKFKVHGKLRWINNGPWLQTQYKPYVSKMLDIILSGRPNCHSSQIGFFTIAQETYEEMKADIRRLEKKYREIAFQDYMLHRDENFVPVTFSFNCVDEDIFDAMRTIPDI